jgi:autotransporter-associated beta strand protein
MKTLLVRFAAGVSPTLILMLSIETSQAASATWRANPISGDWNTAANWTPMTVPNGTSDTATFDTSSQISISLSADTEVSGITFNAGASPFTITARPRFTLTLSSVGVTNSSGNTQNFITTVSTGGNSGAIQFTNSATAGSQTVFTNNAATTTGPAGLTQFFGTSTAGNSIFINNGSVQLNGGGSTFFHGSSTAGSATFTNDSGVLRGGNTIFVETSTAGNGAFTNNGGPGINGGGGEIFFGGSATAGSGTFTSHGGTGRRGRGGVTFFFANSSAGNGTFTNNGSTFRSASGALTAFRDTSSAASGTFTNDGSAFSNAFRGAFTGGRIVFGDASTAGNGTFTNNGGAGHGLVQFFSKSNADSGTFINNGGTIRRANGGQVSFFDTSTASSASFVNNGGSITGAGGGSTVFFDRSAADNATLIANGEVGGRFGGAIQFFDRSHGDMSRVEVFGNGNLDISGHDAPGTTVGSIEGDGDIFLGSRNLKVGNNDLKTNFSGEIKDGGVGGGVGGSLTKNGTGKLVLGHRNTYTGGTIVERGRLIVNNIGESGTGSGPVHVNGGRFGGKGTVAGAVTVGSGVGREAVLSPGYHHSFNPGTLTIQSPLRFNSDGTYEIEVNSGTETVDKVVAFGVTINTGAQTLFADLGNGTFMVGDVFTVIDNTSATPIAGTFSDLPDGAVFTLNGNNFQASYTGGDGNDLTLTVVP